MIKRAETVLEKEFWMQRNLEGLKEGPSLDPFFEIPNQPKSRILELSAGAGNMIAIPLAMMGHEVFATEYTTETRRFLRMFAAMMGVDIRVLALDFDNPRLPRLKFDYIFCRYAFQWASNLQLLKKLLSKVRSRTRRGGSNRFRMIAEDLTYIDGRPRALGSRLSTCNSSTYIRMLEEVYDGCECNIEIAERRVEKDLGLNIWKSVDVEISNITD
jgi:cyclopropane fatty-acyl-phospholipid synthase-like methyltransferase